MKKLKDDQYYYYQFQNPSGWIIGLNRVMFGTRVVIYRDDVTIQGNFCGGNNSEMVGVLFNALYRWLSTDPDNVPRQCRRLHGYENKRPFGNDLSFMWELCILKKKEMQIEHPKGIFELQPIKGL